MGWFDAMLSGADKAMRDEDGAFFIDRSPELFHGILDYLRSGLPGLQREEYSLPVRNRFRGEAEYFQLPELVRYIVVPGVGEHVPHIQNLLSEADSKELGIHSS